MSIFETRKTQALALLKGTGMRESSYLPPAVKLLWRLGIDVPPPHFARFFGAAAMSGLPFGILWGGFMWLTLWRHGGMGPWAAVAGATVAGLCFGMAMAGFYAHGRRKHGLPRWDELA